MEARGRQRKCVRDVQIAYVSRCTQCAQIRRGAADKDARALRNTYDLPRGRPPISGHRLPATPAAGIRIVHTEHPGIRQLEHGAIAQRRTHHRVLHAEREARQSERKRYNVCSERRRLSVREAREGERSLCSGLEREQVVGREERGVRVYLPSIRGLDRVDSRGKNAAKEKQRI
jgi:hypothetical protein